MRASDELREEIEQAGSSLMRTGYLNIDHDGDLTATEAWCLYLSHFLSMWNSRAYEYGAVLFTQALFPGDLLPSSLYGIAETVCILVSSSALGRWVDDSPIRLRPLLISIFTNRVSIVVCCATWLFALSIESSAFKRFTFGLLLLLGMVVKVSRMSNVLSMERDWIPTVAGYASVKVPGRHSSQYDLTHLNTVIRRIDISCKFLSPVAVSGVIALLEPKATAVVLAIMSSLSVAAETFSLLFVWRRNKRLKAEKINIRKNFTSKDHPQGPSSFLMRCMRLAVKFERLMTSQVDGMRYYFQTNVWLPSVGIAVLHASVLDWAGTLITWLLNAGFSYAEVMLAKAIGSIFEIGSTFAFPMIVAYYRRKQLSDGSQPVAYQMVAAQDEDIDRADGKHDRGDDGSLQPDDDDEDDRDVDASARTRASLEPVVRTGHIGIFELLICLWPAVAALFFLDSAIEQPQKNEQQQGQQQQHDHDNDAFSKSPAMAVAFFACISLSFLGRWIYDLSVTQLTQVLVPASHRSEFGGAEMAVIAGVSLLHWIAAAVWHDQSDYKWLSLGSVGAVGVAAALWYHWRGRWNRGLVVAGSGIY